MYGTEVQRGASSAAQGLRSVWQALHGESDASAEVGSLTAAERTASEQDDPAPKGSRAPSAPRVAGTRQQGSLSGERLHVLAQGPAGRSYLSAQYRRRVPWFLVALALHAVLFALFLRPQRMDPPVTPPVPIQTQIITEPHVTPAPPPLKPVALTRPPMQIVVPVPLVTIPDTATISTMTQPAPSAAVAAAPVSAPAAPAEPISPPRFDAAYLHNPAPQYPLRARRLREQGTVLLRVEVSPAGGALQVTVEHSSGWPVLDTSALDAVKRWRFEPARRGADAVAAWVLVPIEFDLRS